jgi:hypothetical protein
MRAARLALWLPLTVPCAAWALALPGCATASPVTAPRPTPLPLEVDAELLPDDSGRVGGVSLRYCLPSTAAVPDDGERARFPRRLVPEDRRALRFLVSAVGEDGRALPVDAEGVKTQKLEGCARLVVDLGRMAEALADKDLALRVGDDVVVAPALWLWRAGPEDDRPLHGAELLLRLERGRFDAMLPWHVEEGGRLVVDSSTFALKSDSAFGRFPIEEIDAGGARFVIARLDDGRAPAQLAAWVAQSATAVAAVMGRYPLPRVNMLVVPTHVTRPIVVGFFSRGGGATAFFFVGEGSPDIGDDDLEATGRWAITHELAHALLPAVRPADAWFNEGLTTWYQELLARRAGMLVDDRAFWHEVVRGLQTGRARAEDDRLTLEEAAARMHETAAYQHAYWGGVGVMLLAEVEARQGGASLEDFVIALRRRFPEDRPRPAAELLAAIDEGPAAVAAAAIKKAWEAERRRPFPEVKATLERLGVAVRDEGVLLDDEAPLAGLRRKITGGEGPPTS